MLESVSVVTGVVIAYWITFATRSLNGNISFRLPFGLQMVCATILGLAIHLLPYSPRWLCLVGRHNDALPSLSKLRRLPPNDQRVQTEWCGIMAEVDFQKAILEKNHPGKRGLKLEVLTWFDLFKRKNWRRTIVGCGIAFFQQVKNSSSILQNTTNQNPVFWNQWIYLLRSNFICVFGSFK